MLLIKKKIGFNIHIKIEYYNSVPLKKNTQNHFDSEIYVEALIKKSLRSMLKKYFDRHYIVARRGRS